MRSQIELLIPSTADFIRSIEIRLPTFDHVFHFHPDIEITAIVRSRGDRIIGDALGEFGPDEVYVLGSNLPHWFRNRPGSYRGQAVAEVLHFSSDPWQSLLKEAGELSSFAVWLQRARSGFLYRGATARLAIAKMRQLRELQGIERMRTFLALIDGLISDSSAIELSTPQLGSTGSVQQTSRIGRCCEYMLSHFDGPLSHEEMAAMAGLSPSAFSRAFKQATRKTFTEFLIEIRLGHAARRIQDTDHTVAEIAFACGFENLSYFNRRFLRKYGLTPRKYREKIR